VTATNHTGAPPVRDHSAKRTWVGQSIRRVEDPKFLRGEGGYIADRITPGTLHAAVLRSPHAHARIVSIDLSAALGLDGVHAVLTHADVPGAKVYGLEFADQPVLAIDRVRYVGEPVVVVAAERPEQARRALEAIVVEYEPLEPVVGDRRHADVRLVRHGRIRRDLRAGAGQRVEQRRLAAVRKPHDPDLERHRRPG